MRRQTALTALVTAGVGAILIWYVVYTRQVAEKFQDEARRSSQMTSIIFKAFNDTTPGAGDQALTAVAALILESGVPMVLTDDDGQPTDWYNLPIGPAGDITLVTPYIAKLDDENPPLHLPGQVIHYGSTPLVRSLRVIPGIQVASIIALLLG